LPSRANRRLRQRQRDRPSIRPARCIGKYRRTNAVRIDHALMPVVVARSTGSPSSIARIARLGEVLRRAEMGRTSRRSRG
jgi:hypothetical protein